MSSSRFVWDFGSYCLNKCAKARFQSTPVSNDSMDYFSKSSWNKIILILLFISLCQICDSRFVWDFGSFCFSYCAKMKYRPSPVSICSCQWISSNHRRGLFERFLLKNNNDIFRIK
ncbi:hypothetical protein I4U23_004757 [Adineta vaga]|nr:hypothetical protein I4U23_004757 [Adineta vaga]